jgi:hypothetical protein
VEREAKRAKLWLNPVRLHESGGFSRFEINRLRVLIERHEQRLLGGWHEFFGD